MARRWRIRHKLLLGLATATAILVLLLAGTLNGLWSYYVTVKVIEAKLGELNAADAFKAEVARMSSKDDRKPFPHRVFDLRDYHIHTTIDALNTYSAGFQRTLERELSADDGVHISGVLGKLREQLTSLHTFCDNLINSGMFDKVELRQEDAGFKDSRETLQHKLDFLGTTTDDLRNKICDDLKQRMKKSCRHYQITLAILISISVLSLLLMASGFRFFSGWIFHPVRDLQQGITRAAQGDFEHRIEVHSGDEMEELAAAYNDMTCRLRDLYRDMARQINERSHQLVRSERLASVGFLAAGVAHEINNPLASIAFCSEALEARLEELRLLAGQTGRGGRDVDVFAKYLKMIQEEAFRCKRITERLLEVSRGGDDKRERVDLAGLIQSVLEVTQHHPTSKNKQIVFEPVSPVFAWICAEEIKSVVLNLVFNALESMEEGGSLTIELRQKGGMGELAFVDTGCGMTQDVLDNIFEPFFTHSRSGKGTGLGLTITHRIVTQHGGEIEAASRGAEQGSTFRVRLPLQPPAEPVKEENLGHAA